MKKSYKLQTSPSNVVIHLNTQEEVFDSDKENWTPQFSKESELQRFVSLSCVENKEQDTYASDKEHLISFDQKEEHASFEGPPSVAMSSLNLKEDMFYSDREMQTPESFRVQRREEQNFENRVDDEKEDTSALDKDNMRPQLSFDRVLRKNHRDLLGSSSVDISSLNVEENQFQYDRVDWTPEVSGDLKLERPISKNNASNKRDEEPFALDKENLSTEFYSDQKFRSNQNEQQPSVATSNAEAVFHSDKENPTPEVPRAQKIKKPIFENCGTNAGGEDSFLSDKENLTPDVPRAQRSIKPIPESLAKVEREIMRQRVERVPFQLLLDDNCVMNGQRMVEKCNNTSINSISAKNYPVNNTERVEDKSKGTLNQPTGQIPGKVEEKKKWNIVVDTSCFLNAESERSLRLLEGLKGTHLIIPMMVIRELDCMKRHESWFRKEAKASSALKWIEECMVKSSWWIHVQSSSEMITVASTPPASPNSLSAEGNNECGAVPSGLMGFSSSGSLMEIVSPTVEDHILDTALLFKRIKTDGQLVLLSNNITLKIKAMAEGLLCEAPKEFRDSLVNPYSKRFLWRKSSPRGSTWSSSDQMAYTENYHQLPKIRNVADGETGLKLILLHNSDYAQSIFFQEHA
ncbi:putative FHA domain-containing protein PS1 [Cocos nucifera]|uniref:Putative FHA domain-containing protein PS1 n=1 Tax=Cocos nucifera TaxID=13894 RepID=A0A8K0HWK6_COCNU|nr:putative FHA domain-containing protein PS1 [Cocos nucifera]